MAKQPYCKMSVLDKLNVHFCSSQGEQEAGHFTEYCVLML